MNSAAKSPSNTQKSHNFTGKGLLSKKNIDLRVSPSVDQGINFYINDTEIKALESSISNSARNTVLASGNECICITEHFLAAASLAGISALNVELNEAELPFGDGSCFFWLEFFVQSGLLESSTNLSPALKQKKIHLDFEAFKIEDGDKYILCKPSKANFKASYHMLMDHPMIGEKKFSWDLEKHNIDEVARARTFSSEAENKMLGNSGLVLGITEEAFTEPLLFDDEPARHKLLDLIGDLTLCGSNPLLLNLDIECYKSGHALNAKLAKKIAELLN